MTELRREIKLRNKVYFTACTKPLNGVTTHLLSFLHGRVCLFSVQADERQYLHPHKRGTFLTFDFFTGLLLANVFLQCIFLCKLCQFVWVFMNLPVLCALSNMNIEMGFNINNWSTIGGAV